MLHVHKDVFLYTPPLIHVLIIFEPVIYEHLDFSLPSPAFVQRIVITESPLNASCATVYLVISNCSESVDKVRERRRYFSRRPSRDNLGQLTLALALIGPPKPGAVYIGARADRTGQSITGRERERIVGPKRRYFAFLAFIIFI